MKVRLKEAVQHFGVHPDTLRRWANDGKIATAGVTPDGHRFFDLNEIRLLVKSPTGRLLPQAKPTIAYARVSSHDQKQDLIRQVEQLQLFCSAHGWEHKIIEDLGSGMNYTKKV